MKARSEEASRWSCIARAYVLQEVLYLQVQENRLQKINKQGLTTPSFQVTGFYGGNLTRTFGN